MATGRAIFQLHVDDLQAETLPFIFQWTLPAAVLKRETLAWGPGDTTLSIPTGATFVIVEPPATTPGSLKVKADAADIGWTISSSMPTILTITGVTAKILGASLAVTGIQLTYV